MAAKQDPQALLSELVGFRSDVDGGDERRLADRYAELLRARNADDVIVADVPRADGKKSASYVYARFGTPKLLVNVHLDTVPPNAAWSSDPFTARIDGGKLYALGAADTKGASAAILCALEEVTPRDTGILFSGDEEFTGVAIRAFAKSAHFQGIENALVCEPTNLHIGTRHRGIMAFELSVESAGGHSSKADLMPSPVGQLARAAVAFDDWAKKHKDLGPPGFPGMCVNLAKLDGGVAFNVIPARTKLTVSLRPPPGADTSALLTELTELARNIVPDAQMKWTHHNKPFATKELGRFEKLLGKGAGPSTDLGFWTEAAVLADAGVDAVVVGTGDIAQAHGPDEWVFVEELARAKDLFRDVFQR